MTSCCARSEGGVLPTHHRDPFDRITMVRRQHHRDPFDRVFVTQAQIEELTLVTADSTFTHYDVRLIRVGALQPR